MIFACYVTREDESLNCGGQAPDPHRGKARCGPWEDGGDSEGGLQGAFFVGAANDKLSCMQTQYNIISKTKPNRIPYCIISHSIA